MTVLHTGPLRTAAAHAARAVLAAIVLCAAARAAEPVSPVAVPYSSGPAFPQKRDPSQPPDAQYAAGRAVDRDPATFCCLLDDSLGGDRSDTIPPGARSPVTGHMVLDLGRPMPVAGARLTARRDGGPFNPKNVDFFYFADDDPANNRRGDDLEHDADLKPLVRGQDLPPLANGAAAVVAWDPVTVRYVGLRVNDSYESGGVHFNFQIGEIELLTGAKPDAAQQAELARNGFPGSPRRPAAQAAAQAARDSETPRDVLAALAVAASRLRLAVDDLAASYPGRYPKAELLERLARWERSLAQVNPDSARARDAEPLAAEFRAIRHDALVARNPLVQQSPILFVKRFSYAPGWYYADFMRASRFDGNLCVLSPADGRVRELVPQLRGGIFDRFDLSFDGRRVVFGYKAAPGKGFRLYEVGVDGAGLRQVTFDPPDEPQRIEKYWHPSMRASGVYRHHTDDFHPCYLPDGGIAFASTRCEQGVLCDQGDSLAVNVLYRVEADGSRMRRLSRGALSESAPSVTGDGRILYTRWEYVDKGVIAVQSLWTMRPDGSGSAEVFGNDIEDPPVLIHGRAVPGSSHEYVCTCTLHHPFAVGPLALIDTRRDIRTLEPIRWLTRETGLSIAQSGTFPHGECFTHLRGGQWVADNRGPLYADPCPLSDPVTGAGSGKYFLAVCNPDRPWNDATAYGLCLVDVFGNQAPVYSDPAISCWQPMPLRVRPVPPVLPKVESAAAAGPAESGEATLLLADVYQGLEGVPRGTVKHLRVWEQVPRPWSARRFWPHDEALGQHAVISLNAHIHVKILHGVVPVRDDGSACFVVPAERNLFFQALDGDFMEVERMRSFVNLEPGETRSCVGCHEHRGRTPSGARPSALDGPPDRLGPQPGETVPRTLYYPTDVQPILDRHCVRCHNAEKPEGGFDLSGQLTQFFSRSYESLMQKGQVAAVQEFIGPDPDGQKTNVVPLRPMALGSHASRLIQVLRRGHYEAKLSREEWVRLVTWVDANAPYYGSYFGRRNLVYRDHPDFRPVPTLRSAEGIAP